MKNIVFDLGRVVFHRDPAFCDPALFEFFAFIHTDPMPAFWVEYDRGALSFDAVVEELMRIKGSSREQTLTYLLKTIDLQTAIIPTERLIADLKAAGYRLYVLSNMSHEYIAQLRRQPVYRHFDGEVVSCEEGTVKPEAEIYRRLLGRYNLDPAETLFIDDRQVNLDAAACFGISTFLFRHHEAEESCAALRERLLPRG